MNSAATTTHQTRERKKRHCTRCRHEAVGEGLVEGRLDHRARACSEAVHPHGHVALELQRQHVGGGEIRGLHAEAAEHDAQVGVRNTMR